MEKNKWRILCEEWKNIKTIEKADMSQYTSFKAGGEAALLAIPKDLAELQQVLRASHEKGIPFLLLGNGSNLLVRDGGFEGLIIKLGEEWKQISVNPKEGTLQGGAGVGMGQVARAAGESGLAGFEPLSGIPGSLGGALFMNAGAYDGEMSFVVKEALVLPSQGGEPRIVKKEEMRLSYRRSIFQQSGEVILQVTLQLSPGEPLDIQERVNTLTQRRNEKQPMDYPSAGSFFKRPEGYFAGKLITDAGLKGLRIGGAQVSPLHAGFIINTGGATVEDIQLLMKVVQRTVKDQFQVTLEPEVRFVGTDKEEL